MSERRLWPLHLIVAGCYVGIASRLQHEPLLVWGLFLLLALVNVMSGMNHRTSQRRAEERMLDREDPGLETILADREVRLLRRFGPSRELPLSVLSREERSIALRAADRDLLELVLPPQSVQALLRVTVSGEVLLRANKEELE